jgi:uncharacterized protein YbcC (UPF0753/DUF2309 family)
MNDSERIQLNKLIKNNDVEDMTAEIRKKCHSDKIKQDVLQMLELKKQHNAMNETNEETISNILEIKCSFLFNNYTDIFNRIKKDEIEIPILNQFLKVLKDIEENKIDQHDGSYQIGKLLKKIYIDSAIIRSNKLDENTKEPISIPPVNISWKTFKKNNIEIKYLKQK